MKEKVNIFQKAAGQLKKRMMVFTITLLVIFFMIVFKLSDVNNLSKAGSDLISKYAASLSPFNLFYDIKNDDVFNFAVNNEMTLNIEQSKLLRIEQVTAEKEKIIVTDKPSEPDPISYKDYLTKFEFNSSETAGIDSILDSYRSKLSSSILSNNKDAFAFDPNLIVLQKAINADIRNFTKSILKSRSDLVEEITGADKSLNEIKNYLKKLPASRDFLVFTPDTLFSLRLDSEGEKISQDRSDARKLKDKTSSIQPEFSFEFEFDSDGDIKLSELNNKRGVFVIQIPGLDSLRTLKRNKKPDADSVRDNILEFSLNNIARTVDSSLGKAFHDIRTGPWNDFRIKIDSLKVLEKNRDSSAIKSLVELEKQLKLLERIGGASKNR